MKVFHPTVEEFRHPMRYFRRWVQQCASRRRICYNHFGGCSIEAEARNYGVVKVVPPKGWNPPVAMSPQSELGRRFETKRQAVNRLQVGGPGVRACTTDLHDTHTHTHTGGSALPYWARIHTARVLRNGSPRGAIQVRCCLAGGTLWVASTHSRAKQISTVCPRPCTQSYRRRCAQMGSRPAVAGGR